MSSSTERVRRHRLLKRAAAPPKPDPAVALLTSWFGADLVAEIAAAAAGRPLAAVLADIVAAWSAERARVAAWAPTVDAFAARAKPPRERAKPAPLPEPPVPHSTKPARAPRDLPRSAVVAAVERAEARSRRGG